MSEQQEDSLDRLMEAEAVVNRLIDELEEGHVPTMIIIEKLRAVDETIRGVRVCL